MTEVGIFYQLPKPTSLRRCSTVSPVNPWNLISWKKQGHYSFANAINVLTKSRQGIRRNSSWLSLNSRPLVWQPLIHSHGLPASLKFAPNDFSSKLPHNILTALGLPKNCSQGEVEKLGKLVCRCGHLNYLEPMEFSRLVRIHRRTALWWLVNRFNMFSPQSLCIEKCCDLFPQ